jgi:hypothetical protein
MISVISVRYQRRNPYTLLLKRIYQANSYILDKKRVCSRLEKGYEAFINFFLTTITEKVANTNNGRILHEGNSGIGGSADTVKLTT